MRQFIFFIILCLSLFACTKKSKDLAVTENIKISMPFQRLEKELFNINSAEDVQSFFLKYPLVAEQYFDMDSAWAKDTIVIKPKDQVIIKPKDQIVIKPKDPEVIQSFYEYYSNKFLKEFYLEAKNSFGDIAPLQSQLEDFYKHVKFYYPSSAVPKAYTVVTGFNPDKPFFVNDTLLVLSLDFFLGPKSKYRPPYYKYMLDRFEKPYIAPFIALAVSLKYNITDYKDETMLANMIYHGKSLYFSEMMLPELADSMLIMYTGQEIKGIEANQATIWGHFIQNKLLFETQPHLIEKYIGERPKVTEVGDKCPGRIGRWLGWQIVRKYMEKHPEVTLQQLMADKDSQKIFRESKYKPGLD
jgi:gliding motility-associated lipoprotein GldB